MRLVVKFSLLLGSGLVLDDAVMDKRMPVKVSWHQVCLTVVFGKVFPFFLYSNVAGDPSESDFSLDVDKGAKEQLNSLNKRGTWLTIHEGPEWEFERGLSRVSLTAEDGLKFSGEHRNSVSTSVRDNWDSYRACKSFHFDPSDSNKTGCGSEKFCGRLAILFCKPEGGGKSKSSV